MASQLTLILWTDHPTDVSLAAELAAQAAQQIFRSSSMQAAVVSATSVDIAVHDIEAAVKAFSPDPVVEVVAPAAPEVPPAVEPVTPVVVDPPAPEDATPPAVPEGTTGASAGLVTPLPAAPSVALTPDSPLVTSDEHLAVLVQLFEALTPEQKAELDAEVTSLEDAHAALERIYAPLVEAQATADADNPPVA